MHDIWNFKSFEEAKIELLDPMTILIGKNGAGKSNLIEGVELLAEVANGRPLHEISDLGRGGRFEVRGGLAACPRSGNSFGLGFSAALMFQGSLQNIRYQVRIVTVPTARISGEHIEIGTRTLFKTENEIGPGIIRIRYDNFRRGSNKPTAQVPSDRSILSQYSSFGHDRQKAADGLDAVELVKTHLRASFVFDPNPKAMRAYERIGNRVLFRDGSNLSAVLYGLKQGSDSETKVLQSIVSRIQQVPEEPFEDIDFVTTELNDVIFGLRHGPTKRLIDARLLSDGTLRALATLTALETVPEGSRVIIEELDNGVHPSRVTVLVNAMWECSKRRGLNVLCTTHNPATLNALSPEQLTGVVLCFWDPATAASRTLRLLDVPKADTLLESGNLGDLVTRKVFEHNLLQSYASERQEKLKTWLQTLP